MTAQIRAGLASVEDDFQRAKLIERRQKEMVSACENGRSEIRCNVASFYEDARFQLIEQFEIRDIRLVWAPPAGVGNFGGEIDNWQWPRHSGDVAMFRAYVGPDGKPADHADANVPFKSTDYLHIASEPLKPGDFVAVAGYPARTNSFKTSSELDEAVTWSMPERIRMYDQYLAVLGDIKKRNEEAGVAAEPLIRRSANALKNLKGQLEGIARAKIAEARRAEESQLRADAAAAKALDEVSTVVRSRELSRTQDASVMWELSEMPKLVQAAIILVRLADERTKPDEERHPDYQARNFRVLEQRLQALSKTYNRMVDVGVLGLGLSRLFAGPASKSALANDIRRVLELPEGLTEAERMAAMIEARVAQLYGETKLEDLQVRMTLFNARPEALRASSDPMITLGRVIAAALVEAEERQDRARGKLSLAKPVIVDAIVRKRGREIAPDANRTLRITYGTVRGYRSPGKTEDYAPFTTLTEMLAKHQGQDPFDVPARVREAAGRARPMDLVDARIQDVPVDFLADLHITGGNSGSSTVDRFGKVTGVVFDGNYEAIASDWVFLPEITRSIHVDIRYVLWLLREADHADALLAELGRAPAAGLPAKR